MIRRIGGHVSTAGGVLNAIKNTEDIGGNCMQIFAGSPRMWSRKLYDKKDAQEFKSQVKEKNLNPVVIHALYLTNLASDKNEIREKSRQALATDMKNSAAIDSIGVVLHIGSHQGRGFEHAKPIIIKEINRVLEATPASSILLLENSAGQKGKVGSLEELGELLEELDSNRVGVCLDTAHAFESGQAINTNQGIELFIKQIKKHIGINKVKVLHINDSRTKLGSGHDVHENIGEGFIGKKGIDNLINHPSLKHLPLILEVPGFDGKGPDKKNIDILKSLVQ